MGGRSTARLATLALAAVLVAVPAIASVAASAVSHPGDRHAWTTDQVGDATDTSSTDIAVTPDGEVRILYSRGFPGVYVAHREGVSWETSRIEKQASAGGLAIAEDGTEWAVYDVGPVHLAHRSAVDDAWTVETVDQGGSPDVDVGPSDGVHVVYALSDGTTATVRYAQRTGPGSYDSEIAIADDHASLRFDDPAMTVDEQGRVHAVFVDKHDGDWTQRYAVRDTSGSWSFAWLDACTSNPADIAVDGLDQAHVVCHAPGTGLGHYEQTASGWTFEAAATGSDVVPPRPDGHAGYSPSITIDAQDRVHVVFRTAEPGLPDDPTRSAHPYYALRSDGGWHVEPIARDGSETGMVPAIAVDANDQPRVSYVLENRADTAGCFGDPLRVVFPCFELYYAEPVTATATGALG